MKNIFITGGSSGIGLRLTVDYLKEHHTVYSSFFNNSRPLNFLQKKYQTIHPVSIDLLKTESFQFPKTNIDILILCAGVIRNQLLINESSTKFIEILEQNLYANVALCQKIIPLMKTSKNPHIIFVSSHSGYIGNAGQVSYSASKAGLIGLAKTLAKEHSKDNIKVNVILPGFMKSKQTLTMPIELENKYKSQNILNRYNTLAEISKFIQLITDTQNISGQIFKLDSRI